MQFISPQIDFAFKRIFGNEQHKEVLISFLNSVLDLSGERQVDRGQAGKSLPSATARAIKRKHP